MVKNRPLSARQVAAYLLTLVNEDEGDFITPLKLQKLLYYCQGFHLAMYDRPLFGDAIKAWKHGPVVPDVWQAYREYGSRPIDREPKPDIDDISRQQRDLIDEVYAVYGVYSASALRAMTHDEPPYRDTVENETISAAALRAYFLTRLRQP